MKIRTFFFLIVALISAVVTSAFAQHVGDATYYGNKFHGRRTSDGSRYHKDSLTCAHRTLPFGTYLKVRNPKTDREVVVRVTDRGPFRKGAIVDLSYAAAREIGLLSAGVASVEVTELSRPAGPLDNGDGGNFVLPELQLLDPATGKYYTATEWAERGQQDRELAKKNAAASFRDRNLAETKEQPRWRVLNDKMTAKVSTLKKEK